MLHIQNNFIISVKILSINKNINYQILLLFNVIYMLLKLIVYKII